jgi:uncharacterized membrane protein
VAHAFKDGIARAVSAPAIVAGTVAVIWLLSLPLPDATFEGAPALRATLAAVAVWSFAWGGILDRYARNRPTRGRGFFGACGAHFPALLRLGLVVLLVDAAIGWAVAETAYAVLATVVGMVATFARIRIVVEDRRSALGATLGALRFLRRNPAGIGLVVVFAVLQTLAVVGVSLAVDPDSLTGWRRALAEGSIAVPVILTLVEHAAGVSLFQSRLAHASYTAAPPIEWPESPAAEAITNRIPGTAP